MRMPAFACLIALIVVAGCKKSDDAATDAPPADNAAAPQDTSAGGSFPIGMMLMQPAIAAAEGETQTNSYTMEPSHAQVMFAIGHFGMSYTYGTFNEVSGSYHIDADDPSKSNFEMVIQTDSIDTGTAKRDEHLRNDDFFSAAQFPEITFKSTKVEKDGDVYNVTGDFTMHGVTNEITVPLTKIGEGVDPTGKYRSGFVSQFTLKRSDYGIDYGLENVGDEVGITLSFEGTVAEDN